MAIDTSLIVPDRGALFSAPPPCCGETCAPASRSPPGFARAFSGLPAGRWYCTVRRCTAICSRPGSNLGLTNAASLVAWAITLLFLMAALFQPVESLGTADPAAGRAGVAARMAVAEASHLALPGASRVQAAHIVVSFLAYSLLSIAMVQGLMLGLQERALHRRHAGGFLRNLPPLETMERLLFRMIGVGFALLTLTLVSGVFFGEAMFGKALRFTHHIVLPLIAWFAFGVLLVGRTPVRLARPHGRALDAGRVFPAGSRLFRQQICRSKCCFSRA
ncbi:MAG: cytochrome c biogenesis protein CcsA [Chromatiales bacterium]|nr:cytochrome c biogenesis protein CcsA [Chromatiales bacterium]